MEGGIGEVRPDGFRVEVRDDVRQLQAVLPVLVLSESAALRPKGEEPDLL